MQESRITTISSKKISQSSKVDRMSDCSKNKDNVKNNLK